MDRCNKRPVYDSSMTAMCNMCRYLWFQYISCNINNNLLKTICEGDTSFGLELHLDSCNLQEKKVSFCFNSWVIDIFQPAAPRQKNVYKEKKLLPDDGLLLREPRTENHWVLTPVRFFLTSAGAIPGKNFILLELLHFPMKRA